MRYRVQLIYGHYGERPQRRARREIRRKIRQIARQMQAMLDASFPDHKIRVRFKRRRRWLAVPILEVRNYYEGSDLGNVSRTLREAGWARTDRIFVIFLDDGESQSGTAQRRPALPPGDNRDVTAACVNRWTPEVALHEFLHTIGAVRGGAPHYYLGGHTDQPDDVMSNGYVTKRLESSHVDEGADDYFNPDPQPGSFLALNPEANCANSPYLRIVQRQG